MGEIIEGPGSSLGSQGYGAIAILKRLVEQRLEQRRMQQKQYEAQLQSQIEAAKLASANTIDNVAKVQTGDALQTTDGLTSSKKRKQGASISSALGVV